MIGLALIFYLCFCGVVWYLAKLLNSPVIVWLVLAVTFTPILIIFVLSVVLTLKAVYNGFTFLKKQIL